MKYFLSLLFLLPLTNCSDEFEFEPGSPEALLGTWQLVEILADPGDGSGTYTPVDSNKMIVFDNNGRFSSNGAICSFAAAVNENVEGTYEIFSDTEFRIYCAVENLDYVTLFLENEVLIVNYPCIEPWSHKYIKID